MSSQLKVRENRPPSLAGMMRFAFGVLFLLGLLGSVTIYFLFFHRYTTNHVESVSLDGLYRCEVVEKSDSGQSSATVTIQRLAQWSNGDSRTGTRGRLKYDQIYEGVIHNDSLRRNAYMIEWQHDDQLKTTGVKVFAAWDEPPRKAPIPMIEFSLAGSQVQRVPSSAPARNVLHAP